VCLLGLNFPQDMTLEHAVDDPTGLGATCEVDIAHFQDRFVLNPGVGVVDVPEDHKSVGFYELHLLLSFLFLVLLVVVFELVIFCPKVLKLGVIGVEF
jgi:hypothetical protein